MGHSGLKVTVVYPKMGSWTVFWRLRLNQCFEEARMMRPPGQKPNEMIKMRAGGRKNPRWKGRGW
jgi:hypothetical protein